MIAPPTPTEAWQRLVDGNRRFTSGIPSHPHQDVERRNSLVAEQAPFAIIFGCSDSRLAAEIIFDLGLGDIFVVRTAGQVIDDAVLGSLEFGVGVLNVALIVVLGHDSCGAVTATRDAVVSGNMPDGFVRDLVERITPSVLNAQRTGHDDLDSMTDEHVKQTSERIVATSRIIADAVDDGRTAVLGVSYALEDGTTRVVNHVGHLEGDISLDGASSA